MIDKEILDNFVNGFGDNFKYLLEDSVYEEHRDKISFLFRSPIEDIQMHLEICIYDVSNNPAYYNYMLGKQPKYMGYINHINLGGIHYVTEFPEYYAEEDWTEETGYPDGYRYEHNGIEERSSDNMNDLIYGLIEIYFKRIIRYHNLISDIGGVNILIMPEHNGNIIETLNELE